MVGSTHSPVCEDQADHFLQSWHCGWCCKCLVFWWCWSCSSTPWATVCLLVPSPSSTFFFRSVWVIYIADARTSQDDTFDKAADLGGILGEVVVEAMQTFTASNNALMHGEDINGDLRDYFRGGSFVAFPGVDKNAVTDAMNALLVGHAVNQLWRQQKIFILGGGACGDNQGIGSGPQDFMLCKDGRAWYLYYW